MFLKIIFLLFLFCLFSLALCKIDEKQHGKSGARVSFEKKNVATSTREVFSKVPIEASNLPASLQTDAAECLRIAYELENTDAGRVILFVSLFTERYPTYQWNVVLNYQHIYYHSVYYYVRLRAANGDVVFLFASHN